MKVESLEDHANCEIRGVITQRTGVEFDVEFDQVFQILYLQPNWGKGEEILEVEIITATCSEHNVSIRLVPDV